MQSKKRISIRILFELWIIRVVIESVESVWDHYEICDSSKSSNHDAISENDTVTTSCAAVVEEGVQQHLRRVLLVLQDRLGLE